VIPAVPGGPDLAGEKRALRRRILALRDALDSKARAEASRAIATKLLALPGYREARVVLAYLTFGSEFDTTAFVEDVLASDRTLVLPRIERGTHSLVLHAVPALCGTLVPGPWDIREPDPAVCAVVAPQAVEFVLVPGLAFSAHCERLGYGGGFYDRLLPRIPAHACRACAAFDVQIVERLPIGDTDQRVSCVLTETRAFPLQSPAA